jgi:BirA family biotin operon repressor/biotin-[acetyl-CoA-carboxylase] ligase
MNLVELQQTLIGLPVGGLRYFDRVGSTNDEAANWAEQGAADLALVIADEQIAGRGRQGRKWFTPAGTALAFSLVLKDFDQEALADILSRLTGLGALAVTEALRSDYGLPAVIKWPNDILLEQRKVGGVLAEASWIGSRLNSMILGIGINVQAGSVPPASECFFPAGCVETVLGRSVSRRELLRSILAHLLAWRERLGRPDFIQAWEERLAFKGEWVQIANGTLHRLGAGGLDLSTNTVKIVGLDEQGRLKGRDQAGNLLFLHSGEVRLCPV